MKKLIPLLLILLTGTAHAAPPSSDIDFEALEACDRADTSHADKGDCKFNVKEAVQNKMLTALEAERKQASATDKQLRAANAPLSDNETLLRKSQDAFKTYLESECRRQMAQMQSGTAGADVQINCEIHLMKQRISRFTAPTS